MRIPLEDLLLETDAPFMVPNLPTDVPNYSVPGMALCVAQAVAGEFPSSRWPLLDKIATQRQLLAMTAALSLSPPENRIAKQLSSF